MPLATLQPSAVACPRLARPVGVVWGGEQRLVELAEDAYYTTPCSRTLLRYCGEIGQRLVKLLKRAVA